MSLTVLHLSNFPFPQVAISLLSLFIFDMSPSANMAVRFVSYKFTKLVCKLNAVSIGDV